MKTNVYKVTYVAWCTPYNDGRPVKSFDFDGTDYVASKTPDKKTIIDILYHTYNKERYTIKEDSLKIKEVEQNIDITSRAIDAHRGTLEYFKEIEDSLVGTKVVRTLYKVVSFGDGQTYFNRAFENKPDLHCRTYIKYADIKC